MLAGGRRWERDHSGVEQETKQAANRVDTCVFAFVVLGLLAYGAAVSQAQPWMAVAAIMFAIWRAVDIVATAIRISLFDHLDRNAAKIGVASHTRVIVLALINFAELAVAFATVYAVHHDLIQAGNGVAMPDGDWIGPLYFSGVTQLTIGYGDYHPVGWLRLVPITQGLFAVALLSMLIARFGGMLKPIPSLDESGKEE